MIYLLETQESHYHIEAKDYFIDEDHTLTFTELGDVEYFVWESEQWVSLHYVFQDSYHHLVTNSERTESDDAQEVE